MAPTVDYALARRRVLRDVERGALSKLDVCDAQPELMRAASNVGEPASFPCPICAAESVVYVQYVYGTGLRAANGRCISAPGELEMLGRKHEEFDSYDVEVCTECRWNFLGRRHLRGRRHAG